MGNCITVFLSCVDSTESRTSIIPAKYTRQKYGCAISQDTVYPPAFDYRILFEIYFTVTRVSQIAGIANHIRNFLRFYEIIKKNGCG